MRTLGTRGGLKSVRSLTSYSHEHLGGNSAFGLGTVDIPKNISRGRNREMSLRESK